MALMPKRVKHRKSQRGRIKGNATRGHRVVFGEYGLLAVAGGWVSAQTIEAGRIAMTRFIKRVRWGDWAMPILPSGIANWHAV